MTDQQQERERLAQERLPALEREVYTLRLGIAAAERARDAYAHRALEAEARELTIEQACTVLQDVIDAHVIEHLAFGENDIVIVALDTGTTYTGESLFSAVQAMLEEQEAANGTDG